MFSIITFSLFFLNTMTAFAAITIGATSPGDYNNYPCGMGERTVGNVLCDKFITVITSKPTFGDPFANKSFNWQKTLSWENDLTAGADSVDFMLFSGHGFKVGNEGVSYNSSHFYTKNSSTSFHEQNQHSDGESNADTCEIYWGYGSAITKWVALFSCNFLNTSDTLWNSVMWGAHQVLGFGSVMYIHSGQGTRFAQYLFNGKEVRQAFLDSCKEFQPYNDTPTICTVLFANRSDHDTIMSFSDKPPSIFSGEEQYYYQNITVQPN